MISGEQKDERLRDALMAAAASYFARESGNQSLITVTDAKVSDRGKKVDILISVYPPHRADAALDFILRHKSDLFEHMRDHVSLSHLPSIMVNLDHGEMNRQKVDELLDGGIR